MINNLYYRKPCSPCKDCADRLVGCHSTCGKYTEWSEAGKIASEKISKQKLSDNIKKQHEINRAIRRKKERGMR